MDLKEFIVSAISDIAEGVAEADARIQHLGGLVNPGTLISHDSEDPLLPPDLQPSKTTLNFDIAVSASRKTGGEGAASAKILVIEAKVGGKSESSSETVSRLAFSIDVVLPTDKLQYFRIGRL